MPLDNDNHTRYRSSVTDTSSDRPIGFSAVASPPSVSSTQTEPRWYQSVRTRFGLLLGLALLPWLIVTGAEALATLDRNRVSQSQLADVVAANVVREVGRTLEAGRLGLEAAPLLLEEQGCERGAQDVLNRLDVYEALIVKGEGDGPVCQMPPSIESLQIETPVPFSEDNLFRIERGRITQNGDARTVVVLQTSVRSTGRVYTLVLPQDFGPWRYIEAALGADASLALTKPDGSAVIGVDSPPEKHRRLVDLIASDTETIINMTNEAGEARRLASRYFEDLNLYITVGRSAKTGAISSFVNPYTSVLLPILAWLIGFGMIWAGTQTMLLTPIRKVRQTARRFASGRLDTRVDLSGSAAAEVYGLATSFNIMASQLQERENRIADNIDEKDTLMREIHHRVKNNLQIIISLLNMQERKAETVEAMAAIAETRTRINAIAIVHRGLYESSDLRQIDVGPFISRLLGSVADSLSLDEAGVTLTHSVDPCHLSADNSIPISLFIVEAISNAAKHGVDRGGHIHVCVTRTDDDRLVIEVSDDGRGVGDTDNMRGIGTRLMKGFARQLAGDLDFRSNDPGLVARLILPIEERLEEPFQVSRKDQASRKTQDAPDD